MTLTKQEETALLFIIELGKHPEVRMSLSTISRDVGIPLPFLKKIARLLKLHGIVESKEGMDGGYTLHSSPSSISVVSIFDAVSEKMLNDGSFSGFPRMCPLRGSCTRQKIRHLITASLLSYLSDVTIDQFVQKEKSI